MKTIERPYRVTWIDANHNTIILGRYNDWQVAADACDEHGPGTNVESHINGIGWVLDNEGIALALQGD